ncbi:hypothetical protein QQ045_025886 [Rhodiola kirilowii]
MSCSTLYSIPLTRALPSVSGHPHIHTQFRTIHQLSSSNRNSLHLSGRLRLTSLRAFRPSAFVGGGGGGIEGCSFGGGDGDGGSDSEVINTAAAVEIADDISDPAADFIVLHVTGMTCGGCASSVKRILESQPKVSSANVDLAAETATIWPIVDAKEEPEWWKQLGQELATHLTNCGFQSNIRG